MDLKSQVAKGLDLWKRGMLQFPTLAVPPPAGTPKDPRSVPLDAGCKLRVPRALGYQRPPRSRDLTF